MTRVGGTGIGGTLREGQVFILTLGAIIALSALLAGVWAVQGAATRSAMATLDRVLLEQDLASAREMAIHALLTEPIDGRSLHYGGRLNRDILEGGLVEEGEAIVDLRGGPRIVDLNGRRIIVRIIAMNGLAPLDWSRPQALRLLLEQLGLDPPEADQLAARLEDYTDPDDLRRLNGAESADYPDGEGPANRPLRSAAEACAVLGWDALELCADARVMDLLFNPDIGGSANPALMPDYLAALLLNTDRARETAQDLLGDIDALSYAALGLPGWDGAVDPELMGYGGAGPGFMILTHAPEARVVAAQRIDLSFGSIDRPVRRGFSHVIGGAWVETTFRIEDIDAVDAFPVPVPETGDE